MKIQTFHYDVNSLKRSVPPFEFYLKELGLERYGYRSGHWALAGLCPFHNDNSAGSFKVNLQSGAYKCFSCGAGGGDVIAFLRERYGLSFKDALQLLKQVGGAR